MPRAMPALGTAFRHQVDAALLIARAAELARDTLPPRTAARLLLTPTRVDAIYEMAFLRIFVAWEVFLEESFVRMLCRWGSAIWQPALIDTTRRFNSLAVARQTLYDGRPYILWHNPQYSVDRAQKWFVNGPHETVVASSMARLDWLAAVRHRIAHGSDDARAKFDLAAIQIAGRRYPAASAGRLLRDWNLRSQSTNDG